MLDDRRRHFYVIGKTGVERPLMENMAIQIFKTATESVLLIDVKS